MLCVVACGIVTSGCQAVDAKKYDPQGYSSEERTEANCEKAIRELSTQVTIQNFNKRVKECVGG